MTNNLKESIFLLRDEVTKMVTDALAKQGDSLKRWQRAQKIKILMPELKKQIATQPVSERPALDKALRKINNNLIFLLADSNRPDQLQDEESSTEVIVRRIYNEALQIASDFALKRKNPDQLRKKAETLRQELISVAKGGANTNTDWQRMLSDANLDLTYVTSYGKRPHSTRLAHYIADARNPNR